MQAKHELISYGKREKVWVGKYKNSRNLPHWHYDCELIFAEQGNLVIMYNKEIFRLNKGQALFIDSEKLHYISAESTDSILITFFFASDIIKRFAENYELASPVLSSDYNIPELYKKVREELKQKHKFYEINSELLVSSLMLNIFRNENTVPRHKSKPAAESFKRLLKLIDEEYEFITFEKAALFMGMNPAYFSRFFNKLAGMSFSAYLNFIKINKAVELLNAKNGLTVTEIAMKSGFSTIRNFNRIFKEITGYTPSSLPEDFILDDIIYRTGSVDGNPTLKGCELIESSI